MGSLDSKRIVILHEGGPSLQESIRAAFEKRRWRCEFAELAANFHVGSLPRTSAVVFLDGDADSQTEALISRVRMIWPAAALAVRAAAPTAEDVIGWVRAGVREIILKSADPQDVVACAERIAPAGAGAPLASRPADRPAPSNISGAIRSLVEVMEAKDRYSIGYAKEVVRLSDELAKRLGMSPAQRQTLRLAAVLHDVGRVALRDDIVNKHGKLTPEELEHIATHPEAGERIVGHLFSDPELLSMVRHHHEWFDGRGYPDHLKGETIPLGARVLAVADAFAAMTQERPHRPPRTSEEAIKEICSASSSQFCPRVVSVLLDAMGYRPPDAAGDPPRAAEAPQRDADPPAAPPQSAATGPTAETPRPSPLSGPAEAARDVKDVQRRLKQAVDLRALPNIVTDIIEMTSDDERNIEDVAAKIRCDHALATKLLQLANSALYGGRSKVESVDRAVIKLGLDRIRDLVVGVSVINQWQESDATGRVNREDFWKHSMATALLSQRIASLCCRDQLDGAFTAGLLHDVGQLVMQEALGDQYARIIESVRLGTTSLAAAERAAFGIDHGAAIRVVGPDWNMPDELINGIAWHHASWDEVQKIPGGDMRFVLCVRIADVLATVLGLGTDVSSIEMVPPTFLHFLGLKGEAAPNLLDGVADEVAGLGRSYGLVTSDGQREAPPRKAPQRPGHYVTEGDATLDPIWQFLVAQGCEVDSTASLNAWAAEAEASWCWVRVATPAFTRQVIEGLQHIKGDARQVRRNLLLLLPMGSSSAMQRLLAEAQISYAVEPWGLGRLADSLSRLRSVAAANGQAEARESAQAAEAAAAGGTPNQQ